MEDDRKKNRFLHIRNFLGDIFYTPSNYENQLIAIKLSLLSNNINNAKLIHKNFAIIKL